MHTYLYRLNALFTVASTALAVICAATALTDWSFTPRPSVDLKIKSFDGLQVLASCIQTTATHFAVEHLRVGALLPVMPMGYQLDRLRCFCRAAGVRPGQGVAHPVPGCRPAERVPLEHQAGAQQRSLRAIPFHLACMAAGTAICSLPCRDLQCQSSTPTNNTARAIVGMWALKIMREDTQHNRV